MIFDLPTVDFDDDDITISRLTSTIRRIKTLHIFILIFTSLNECLQKVRWCLLLAYHFNFIFLRTYAAFLFICKTRESGGKGTKPPENQRFSGCCNSPCFLETTSFSCVHTYVRRKMRFRRNCKKKTTAHFEHGFRNG